MKLIDNHCHLDFRQFDEDRDKVIERCREKLHAVVNSGSDRAANRRALELAEEHTDLVYPCIGLHPTKLDDVTDEVLAEIEGHIRAHKDRIVALGEIGMDFFHEKSGEGRERQREVFKRLLELGEELELPVVVHSRDAEKQVLDVLDGFELPEAIMHCFNGNEQTLERALGAGYWISVSTQVLYSNRVQNIVAKTPADRMLLETDAPFLYPGEERNEPWRIHESLENIAEIKEKDETRLGKQFNNNTRQAYRTRF